MSYFTWTLRNFVVEPAAACVISRVDVPNIGDEVHHTGWNACSSCHDKATEKRSHLIVPCLNSDRIYIINVEKPRGIYLQHTIEPSKLHSLNLSFPHTSHCLADGNIMISTLGEANGKPSGNFLLLDGKTFEPKGTWPSDGKTVPFNYDFWYQPRGNIMISTEWGSPNHIKKGSQYKRIRIKSFFHSNLLMLSVESDVLALADKDYRPFVEDYMNKLTYYLNMPNS
uniref:Vacuolar protein sorting-associated protein 62 n=1 Tax=Caenorhabditis tropicalis TaxID=1561998 RepID=A0A1I7U2T7_9PELO